MRPTDERGRPIGEAARSARGLRGGRAAGFREGRVRYRPYKLAFCSLGRREAFFKGFPCVLWSI